MNTAWIRTGIVLLVLTVAAGCAGTRSGAVYSRDQARAAVEVHNGVVEEVREVMIEGTKTPVGAIAGGVMGGVLGRGVGGGSGRDIATVGGALGGAAVGATAEERLTRRRGLEIQVRLDDGRTLVVVQEADVSFSPGERVRVLKGHDNVYRVRH